ncbi:2-amino-4-hydroxy-6-hydroxymethyldihydropteridine diphosphokinase [Candidatus Sumerlaeota bacterium]|nr:2-amino-4-hydroxy-6-hydroxymethyldihydropteridine diphosphokinase [Candidatus Sumerlaeota bacterium]
MGKKTGHTIYIGLGSNLDDPKAQVLRAVELLRGEKSFTRVTLSPLYHAPAWGVVNQPPFINAAARAHTVLEPEDVLDLLLGIEREMGRKRSAKWGPRCIDLDLLLYDDCIVSTERLIVPHPLLVERAFALKPLLDLSSRLKHPHTGRPLAEYLNVLEADAKRMKKA